MSGKKEGKEKKVAFGESLAPMMDAVLARVAEQNDEQWGAVTFDNEAKQAHLVISRANSRTNAYPKKASGDTEEPPASRAAKRSTAYYYMLAITSILWNNNARLFCVGTDRVWRVDAPGAPPAEIDEAELTTLRQCVDDALQATTVAVTKSFTVRTAKAAVTAAASSSDEEGAEAEGADEGAEDDEDGEDAEETPDWLVDDDEDDEEEEDNEDEEGPPAKRRRVDDHLVELIESLQNTLTAHTDVNREIAELIRAQTALLAQLAGKEVPPCTVGAEPSLSAAE